MMWALLGLLAGLSFATGAALANWRQTMARADWWALTLCSLLLGGTLTWMLLVATGT
jgi:hypothetical protein